jgi:hypothetical protein
MSDLDELFAPVVVKSKSWITRIPTEQQSLLFEVRRRWQGGDREVPIIVLYRRLKEKLGLTVGDTAFREFMASTETSDAVEETSRGGSGRPVAARAKGKARRAKV